MTERIEVQRVEATLTCRPKQQASCGAQLPVHRVTCTECGAQQIRPVPPPVPDAELLRDVVLVCDGQPIVAATTISAFAAGYVAKVADRYAPRKVWGKPRLSGLGDRQIMFGTRQPQPLRRRYGCSRSMVAEKTDTASWATIAAECQDALERLVPEVAAANVEAAECIAPIWKWPGTGWTSGVCNFTQLLPYHRDAGNLPHTWSAMIGARSGVIGGHLHLPEFNATLAVDHRSLICFPGGDVTHGVTPMTVTRLGWRVTAVFYGLRSVRECECTEQAEIERAARRATERARVVASQADLTLAAFNPDEDPE